MYKNGHRPVSSIDLAVPKTLSIIRSDSVPNQPNDRTPPTVRSEHHDSQAKPHEHAENRTTRLTDQAGADTWTGNSRSSNLSMCGKSVPIDVDYSFMSPHTPVEQSLSLRLRAAGNNVVHRYSEREFSCPSIP
jgi:hypothetical protein